MAHTAFTPVFVALRTGLHVLFVALTVLVVIRDLAEPSGNRWAVLVLAATVLVTYWAGAFLASGRRANAHRLGLIWLGILTAQWVVLVWLTPEAAYLAFPLFFLHLHLLGPRIGSVAVIATTAVAIVALGLHGGWSVGAVVGPLIGAVVAILIGTGYDALAREAVRREALMAELIRARDQLAATEREAGMLAERARLAREIHDTVAQGLSSIQLLLHAAERMDPTGPGVEQIRLARETAAANLADTRRFIRELSPPDLDDKSLGGALRRIADSQWAAQGLRVDVSVPDSPHLPMAWQTALLRIAQGAVANAIQHAHAQTATVALTLTGDRVQFTVSDDGQGFDPVIVDESVARSDSFGLRAIRDRVQQLGGAVTVTSAPGQGTSLVVTFTLGGEA